MFTVKIIDKFIKQISAPRLVLEYWKPGQSIYKYIHGSFVEQGQIDNRTWKKFQFNTDIIPQITQELLINSFVFFSGHLDIKVVDAVGNTNPVYPAYGAGWPQLDNGTWAWDLGVGITIDLTISNSGSGQIPIEPPPVELPSTEPSPVEVIPLKSIRVESPSKTTWLLIGLGALGIILYKASRKMK